MTHDNNSHPTRAEMNLIVKQLDRIEQTLDRHMAIAQANHDKIVRIEEGGSPAVKKLWGHHRELEERVAACETRHLVEEGVEKKERMKQGALAAGGGGLIVVIVKALEMLFGGGGGTPPAP